MMPAALADAAAVDHDVHTASCVPRLFDLFGQALGIGEVKGDDEGVFSAEVIAQGVEDFAAAGREDEAVTAPVTSARHGMSNARGGTGNPDRSTRRGHASMLAYLALASMNSRRGGTSSPMSMEKMLSLSAAFSMVTWRSVRFSGFMVVSQSCSAFISPRPL